MKNIVITGSTRGIGLGMAKEFLKHNCKVVISGRSQGSVDTAISSFDKALIGKNVTGYPCDVSDPDAVEKLWQATVEAFGQVDIWINNAGISHSSMRMEELDALTIDQVINTNITGLIYGSQTAMKGMKQQGHGQIYNMEGLGSDGRKQTGLSIYGASKYSVRYLTESLVKEAEGTAVQVGTLSPGMVVTDLLVGDVDRQGENRERTKRVFNILADKVETVTPWLVEKMLSNRKNGAAFRWLTPGKVMLRFLSAPFVKRDVFE